MCIIIFDNRKTDERLAKKVFKRSREKNPDGMGIMWPEDGKLHIWRTMNHFSGIWKRYSDAKKKHLPVAIHFRKTTAGTEVNYNNLHPFIVNTNLAFMHNGTAKDIIKYLPEGVSDTSFINTELLQKFPDGFMDCPIHRIAIRNLVDDGRMLFMDGDGNFNIINEERWGAKWCEGVWFSKSEHLSYFLTGKNKFFYSPPKPAGYWGSDDYLQYDKIDWGTPRKTIVTTPPKKAPPPTVRDIKTAPSKEMVTPKPSVTANLVFDYGYLNRVGYYNPYLKQLGTGVLYNYQLWAIGDHGNEMPAALPIKPNCIIGNIYEISADYANVMDGIDNVYGCDQIQPDISVFRRKWVEVTLVNAHAKSGTKLWAWIYTYAMSLTDVTAAAPVPFGDWSRWDSPTAAPHIKNRTG